MSIARQYLDSWHEERRTCAELRMELQEMHHRCGQLQADLVAVHAMQLYAEDTAPVREFLTRYQLTGGRVAQVLARYCSAYEQTIIVGAGAQQNISIDMIACSENGVVGRVIEVFPWYSRVLLVTDRRCKIPVVGATTKTNAIYEGTNKQARGQLLFVSCLEPLAVGELLLTSGKGMIYPAGFAVGKIATITPDAQGLYYTATVTPAVDPFTVRYCVLIDRGMIAAQRSQMPSS